VAEQNYKGAAESSYSQEIKRAGIEHKGFGRDVYEVKGIQGLVKITEINGVKMAKISNFKPGANKPQVIDTMPLEKLIQKAKSSQLI
jgi:hypothetical protein